MTQIFRTTEKIMDNMTALEKARYAVHMMDQCLEAEKTGKKTREQCDREIDLFVNRYVDTMDVPEYMDYLMALANENTSCLTKQWAIEHLHNLELRIMLLEMGIMDTLHRFDVREVRNYHVSDIDRAAAKATELHEERGELVAPLYQAIADMKAEREQFLNPLLWERIGGLPEVKEPMSLLPLNMDLP